MYLYIHNKYTQYTHVYYVHKTLILDAINRCPPLITFNILCIILIYINMSLFVVIVEALYVHFNRLTKAKFLKWNSCFTNALLWTEPVLNEPFTLKQTWMSIPDGLVFHYSVYYFYRIHYTPSLGNKSSGSLVCCLFAGVQYFIVTRLLRAIFRPSLYRQLTNYNH